MHSQSQIYCDSLRRLRGGSLHLFEAVPLVAHEATELAHCLQRDSQSYLYNAAITLAAAISGIEKKHFSWAVVQLYYCVFYCLRAILACDGLTIIYMSHDTKKNKNVPYSLTAGIGVYPKKENDPSTHKLCIKKYKLLYPNAPFITQDIDNTSPLSWIMKEREKANYNVCRMSEPFPPECFYFVSKNNVRTLSSQYAADTRFVYTFDKDHAVLALPIAIFRECANKLRATSILLAEDEERAKEYLRDRSGPLNYLLHFIRVG